ncbi:MAG TPA: phospholipase D-like domain-containing protein [bacterium]|nr:phospholipase D-like domain-containing protein [bacterium]
MAKKLVAKAYPGDYMTLLAFSLDKSVLDENPNFAGFAIERTDPKGNKRTLYNRLSFDSAYTKATKPEERKWTPSDEAPFQKFRWIDVPPEPLDGEYVYKVTAMFGDGAGVLSRGPSATVKVSLPCEPYKDFELAFTKGYASSQAYAEKFDNADIRPQGEKTIDLKKSEYEKYKARYEWLGGRARRLLMEFLDECVNNKNLSISVFAYDLDEPYLIDCLCRIAREGRLRIILDDSPLHAKPDKNNVPPIEIEAHKTILKASKSKDSVIQGHFSRYSHDKIFIQRDMATGKGLRVLTGSANFSLRGLYVQANSMIVIDDAAVAQLYADTFDEAFECGATYKGFVKGKMTSSWFDAAGKDLPSFKVSFAPHKEPAFSLDTVAESVRDAESSVLFAIMNVYGAGKNVPGGPAMEEIRKLNKRKDVFTYGTVQSQGELSLFKPGAANGNVTSFAYLKSKMPSEFREEWYGGKGMTVHHKFIVKDFNGANPVVYTGSSNLAGGGETKNGDNLLAIRDKGVATAYAVEAVRLFDHYHFRDAMKSATAKGLSLTPPNAKKKWWRPYYDAENIKCRDRRLFALVDD